MPRFKKYRRNWRRFRWQFWRPVKPPADFRNRPIKFFSKIDRIRWKK